MIWSDLRGHHAQVDMFRRAVQRGRLSHAYLFVGPSGIGKRLFARRLAQCLLCERFKETELESCGECRDCRMVRAGTHPDVISVGRLEEKSELTLDVFVGSKEERGRAGVCYELSLRPMMGGRRIALIDDTDLMNTESANALLKTLEEPPADSVLILFSENPDALLLTIRSRCQLVRFAPLPRNDVADLLVKRGMVEDRTDADIVAAMSDGSLDIAAQLLDPQLRQLRNVLYDHLASSSYNWVDASKSVISGLDAIGGSSIEQRRNALWVVRFCVAFYRLVLRSLSTESLPHSGNTNDPVSDRWSAAESAGIQSDMASGSGPDRANLSGQVLERTHFPEQVLRLAGRLSAHRLGDLEGVMACLERAAKTEGQLNRNVTTPLCLEALFADLGHIGRAMKQTG